VRVTNLTDSFTAQAFDLTSAIAQAKTAAGSEDVNDVQIKFQQYDNSCVPYDGREFDNIILNLHGLASQPEQNCVIGTEATYSAYDPNSDSTTVYLHRDLPNEFEDEDQFQEGRYVAGGNTYTVNSSIDKWWPVTDNDEVVVAGNATNAGSCYILYDDDDQNIFNTPHYCGLGSYANAFRAAKIEPIELTTYHTLVAFDRNITNNDLRFGLGSWNQGQQIHSSANFWACTVVACYQQETNADVDPGYNEGATTGCVPEYTNIATIYLETIRDDNDNSEEFVVAHEIGHTGGVHHGTIPEHKHYIMGYDNPDPQFGGWEVDPNANDFYPDDIITFRSHEVWDSSN